MSFLPTTNTLWGAAFSWTIPESIRPKFGERGFWGDFFFRNMPANSWFFLQSELTSIHWDFKKTNSTCVMNQPRKSAPFVSMAMVPGQLTEFGGWFWILGSHGCHDMFPSEDGRTRGEIHRMWNLCQVIFLGYLRIQAVTLEFCWQVYAISFLETAWNHFSTWEWFCLALLSPWIFGSAPSSQFTTHSIQEEPPAGNLILSLKTDHFLILNLTRGY